MAIVELAAYLHGSSSLACRFMGGPSVAIGNHVKIYRQQDGYRREDATAISVNNATGVITARMLRGGPVIQNIVYRDDSTNDTITYWTELPLGWLPE
jgi:hypothetical protein